MTQGSPIAIWGSRCLPTYPSSVHITAKNSLVAKFLGAQATGQENGARALAFQPVAA